MTREFFGDAERDFTLTPDLITELERKTGVGIGALCMKVFNGNFTLAEITETIRLGMIGGGTQPAEADALTKTYIVTPSLTQSHALAVTILDRLYSGAPKDPNAKA